MSATTITRSAIALILTALLVSCATVPPSYDEGQRMIAEGQIEAGLERLREAARANPDNIEIRAAYARQQSLAVNQTLAMAELARREGRYAAAEASYRSVLRMHPNHPRALQGLEQIRIDQRHDAQIVEARKLLDGSDLAGAERLARTIVTQNPAHREARSILREIADRRAEQEATPTALRTALDKPVTLEFQDAGIRTVFEVLARSTGVNFVFDKDVRPDIRVTIFVRNTTLDEVVRLILTTNQLERKFLNENTILIYPDTPAKAREYRELVVKAFYLANADVKQAHALIRTVVKSREVFIDEKLNMIVVRDTEPAIRLAERLLESLDLAEPEVMLEVEVLEVSRSKLLDLGLQWPESVGYGVLNAPTTTVIDPETGRAIVSSEAANIAGGVVDLRNRSGLTTFVTNPALILNLRAQDNDTNLLANPRIRVRNREKARIHIGDKVPVFTTTSTANVGVSASVSYLDVGLKLDVEPQVHLGDEVAIKVGLEVSNIVSREQGPAGSVAYQVGTRSASTTLRIRDGETQVLAGLISDEERGTANKVPGLGDLPLLGRLFSSRSDTRRKNEIVLLITPRIVRNLARPDVSAPALASGTETSIGAAPLVLRSVGPGDLSMSSSGRASAPVSAPPPAPPPGAMPEPAQPEVEGGPGTAAPEQPGEAAQEPAQPVDPTAEPVVSLTGPPEARVGSEFAVTVAVAGSRASQAVLSYDPLLLEVLGGTPVGAGRVVVPVQGTDQGATAQVRFRARGAGEAMVSADVEIPADLASGVGAPTPPPATLTIQLVL